MEHPIVQALLGLEHGAQTSLEPNTHFGAAGHLWSQSEIDALILAAAARRPLLVRGEAGCGKSQIARAAAAVLEAGPPLVEVIHPRFEALDLLYRVDAVERLADAQASTLDRGGKRYVKPGKLWTAIERANAGRAVLLIDEIDKAEADVPNSLLDVLGNRSFDAPGHDQPIQAAPGRFPLVVVTTNEERELPAAFVRRCVVLNLNPPATDEDLVAWLVARGKVHTHLSIADGVREQCARQVLADRKAAAAAGYPRVGLAEHIDLLTALDELTSTARARERAKRQSDWLRRLAAYALVKHADQDQRRPAVGEGDTERP